MKIFIKILLLLIYSNSFGQVVNQFDQDGLRHGIWKKTFDGTNDFRYEGQFNHGKETGLFKFYKYIDKKSVLSATKQYNHDDNIAEVKFFSSKGKLISNGSMKGKNFIGVWTYYHRNSDVVLRTEQYDNEGLQQGELLVFYENGTVAEKSLYKNGKLDGKSFLYNEDGVKIKEYTYSDNVLNGSSKFYTSRGQILIEGSYRDGKKHGIWKYYKDGELKETKDFTKHSKNPFKKKAP
jgi:antitoxin component YwqK of YwqJK toxin-antitoxin module